MKYLFEFVVEIVALEVAIWYALKGAWALIQWKVRRNVRRNNS